MEKQIQPQGQRTGWLKNGNLAKSIRAQPRCQAKAKSTGQRCGNIAVKGKRVCYIHGGRSVGAPKGNQHNWRHGFYTAKAKQERKIIKESIQKHLELLEEIMQSGERK